MARISRLHTAVSNLLLLRRRHFTAGPSPLDAAGPLACRLRSRSVVRFRGPDTVKFLHPLLTNEIRHLEADGGAPPTTFLPTPNINHRSPSPVYAALLTAEGRFLYDLFIYKPPRPEERLDATGSGPGANEKKDPLTLFADVDAAFVDELLQLFKKHNLRSKVEIENVTDKFSCWQRFGSDTSTNGGQESEAQSVGWGSGEDLVGEAVAQGNDRGWKWYNDPRLPCLGYRGIFPAKTIPPLIEVDKEADEKHYLLWRMEKGVAEGPTEIPKGEAIPLEYSLAGLNAISFDKGCYVGQELVARTHHRGVIRKRLLPMKFIDDDGKEYRQTILPKSDIVDFTSNKKVGTVTTSLGSRGMGLLRLEEVMKQSSTLSIKDEKEIRVEVTKPDWWPVEWTRL